MTNSTRDISTLITEHSSEFAAIIFERAMELKDSAKESNPRSRARPLTSVYAEQDKTVEAEKTYVDPASFIMTSSAFLDKLSSESGGNEALISFIRGVFEQIIPDEVRESITEEEFKRYAVKAKTVAASLIQQYSTTYSRIMQSGARRPKLRSLELATTERPLEHMEKLTEVMPNLLAHRERQTKRMELIRKYNLLGYTSLADFLEHLKAEHTRIISDEEGEEGNELLKAAGEYIVSSGMVDRFKRSLEIESDVSIALAELATFTPKEARLITDKAVIFSQELKDNWDGVIWGSGYGRLRHHARELPEETFEFEVTQEDDGEERPADSPFATQGGLDAVISPEYSGNSGGVSSDQDHFLAWATTEPVVYTASRGAGIAASKSSYTADMEKRKKDVEDEFSSMLTGLGIPQVQDGPFRQRLVTDLYQSFGTPVVAHYCKTNAQQAIIGSMLFPASLIAGNPNPFLAAWNTFAVEVRHAVTREQGQAASHNYSASLHTHSQVFAKVYFSKRNKQGESDIDLFGFARQPSGFVFTDQAVIKNDAIMANSEFQWTDPVQSPLGGFAGSYEAKPFKHKEAGEEVEYNCVYKVVGQSQWGHQILLEGSDVDDFSKRRGKFAFSRWELLPSFDGCVGDRYYYLKSDKEQSEASAKRQVELAENDGFAVEDTLKTSPLSGEYMLGAEGGLHKVMIPRFLRTLMKKQGDDNWVPLSKEEKIMVLVKLMDPSSVFYGQYQAFVNVRCQPQLGIPPIKLNAANCAGIIDGNVRRPKQPGTIDGDTTLEERLAQGGYILMKDIFGPNAEFYARQRNFWEKCTNTGEDIKPLFGRSQASEEVPALLLSTGSEELQKKLERFLSDDKTLTYYRNVVNEFKGDEEKLSEDANALTVAESLANLLTSPIIAVQVSGITYYPQLKEELKPKPAADFSM